MSEMIQALAALGSQALSAEECIDEVAALPVSEEQKQALLGNDSALLARLVGARSSMFFGIWAPDDAPAEEEPAEEPGEEPAELER